MKNCILLHLHYQDLWPEFWSYLKDIKDENTDLYVTVNTSNTKWYENIVSNAAGSTFAVSKTYLDLFFNNTEMDLFNIMELPPFPGCGTTAHGLERLISSHTGTFGGTFTTL